MKNTGIMQGSYFTRIYWPLPHTKNEIWTLV